MQEITFLLPNTYVYNTKKNMKITSSKCAKVLRNKEENEEENDTNQE